MNRTKRYYIEVFILCIILLPFSNINAMVSYKSLLYILQIISALIMTIIILKEWKSIKIDSITILLALFCTYQFLISIINSTITMGIMFNIYFLFISIIFIKKSFEKEDYKILQALYILSSFIMIINIPSLIKSIPMPEYKKVFLIGGKNALSIIAILAIYYNYIYNYIYNKKMTKIGILFLLIDLSTLLLSGSSTGIIVGIIMTFFVVFASNLNINSKWYFIIYFLALLLIFNTNNINNIDFLYNFITNTLNKDLTFTGRTIIWQNVGEYIGKNIWGYGRGNSIVLRITGSLNECHNAILELILSGGVPSLILFVLFVYKCLNTKQKKNKLINISRFIIFVFGVIGLTESIIYNMNLWWILIITYSLCKKFLGDECNNDNCIHSNI